MPDFKDSLQPDQVIAQAAALAQHLRDSGVQWLPKPDPAKVALLAESFADASSTAPLEPPTQSASPTATPKTASSNDTRPASPATSQRPATSHQASQNVLPGTSESYSSPSLDPSQRSSELSVLSDQVARCDRCEVLSKCRTKTVFGEGSPTPRVAFFGEGPGRDEDLQGRPFVGKAGQLLTKMIEACKLKREDCYILNTVKCRPPNNRNPEPNEIENCREYFENQLQILQPEYIVCLGAVSSQALLQTKLSVGRLRGKFHPYFASKVIVTYHPAYLLRNPAAKKAAWEDLQLMMRDAGLM